MCESWGGCPGLPVPTKPCGFCGRKVTRNWTSANRVQELCESWGGHPGLPVLKKSRGYCGCKATVKQRLATVPAASSCSPPAAPPCACWGPRCCGRASPSPSLSPPPAPGRRPTSPAPGASPPSSQSLPRCSMRMTKCDTPRICCLVCEITVALVLCLIYSASWWLLEWMKDWSLLLQKSKKRTLFFLSYSGGERKGYVCVTNHLTNTTKSDNQFWQPNMCAVLFSNLLECISDNPPKMHTLPQIKNLTCFSTC